MRNAADVKRPLVSVLVLVTVIMLAAGCRSAPQRAETPHLAPALAKATEAVEGARSAIRAAGVKGLEARTEVLAVSADLGRQAEALRVGSPPEPVAVELDREAARLKDSIAPRLAAAGADLARADAAAGVLLGPVMTELKAGDKAVADLAKERDQWQKEAAREKERADSAVRKWLLITAAGGFAGILAGGALFVWLSRKAGLVVGIASLAVFALSVALYRWFEWFAWGGLVLIGLAVAALGYGLYKNRHAFATLVQGGQDVKAALAEGVQYTKDQIRALFNQVHAAAQTEAGGGVEKMVEDVKSTQGGPASGGEEG